MQREKSLLRHFSVLEDKFDDLMSALKRRLSLNDPVQIIPYRTYGTTNRLFIKGRVLQDKLLKVSSSKDSILTNLANMYRRFESDEIPNAVLKIKHLSKEHYVTTDDEGYFEINIAPDELINLNTIWQSAELSIEKLPFDSNVSTHAVSEILIPPFDAEYGIISDIDDTIVQSSATNFLKMAGTVFLTNAHTRLPFAGVSTFYRSLQLGRNGKRNNPFFYVSSSPWNLYDLLRDFMDINEIPAGPLLLRDFGFDGLKFSGAGNHLEHKLKEIENILITYPLLKFILIGDSGQEDPSIYKEVAKRFPGRILAIYIRSVHIESKEKIAREIAEELKASGVEMLVIDDASEAAKHAADKGFIYHEELPLIDQDKEMDIGFIEGKEEI